MWIDDLLKSNQAFAAGRAHRPLPAVEAVPLAVVACYDPRLDGLLRPALGLAEGEGFLLRTAGAVVTPESTFLKSLALAVYLFEVERVLVVGHASCRMASFPTEDFIAAFRRRGVPRQAFGPGDLRSWAQAIASPRDGVKASVATIAGAPFLPRDLSVAGVVLDDARGRLEVVARPGEVLPAVAPAAAPATAAQPAASTAAAPAPAAPGAPPVPLEALHPSLGALKASVELLAEAGAAADLDRLRSALEAEKHPLRKLQVLRRFIQQLDLEGPEITEAFDLLKRQFSGAGQQLAAGALSDLFGPLFGGKKP